MRSNKIPVKRHRVYGCLYRRGKREGTGMPYLKPGTGFWRMKNDI